MARHLETTAYVCLVLGIKPATLRKWKQRGYVTDHGGRWDVAEVRRAQRKRRVGRPALTSANETVTLSGEGVCLP
jgi:uncharacterized protein YjcR